MNPVKAFIVPSALDYKYSSIGEYKNYRGGILHPNAIHNYKKRFENWEEYLRYHHITNETIFIGMKEEIDMQRSEQVMKLLWEMQVQEKVENVMEILEEPLLREKYMEMIEERLNVSKKQTKRLYAEIKGKYIK